MNRSSMCILLLAVLVLVPPTLSALPLEEPPFLPVIPEAMGRGGTGVAGAEGYSSLFFNPAGFAGPERSLTIASASAWAHADPARFLQALGADEAGAGAEFLDREIAGSGAGYGAATGLGYVGGGLGLGLAVVMDSWLYGDPAADAVGEISFTAGAIVGFGFPIRLFGRRVDLGAGVRPMVRVRAPFDYEAALAFTEAFRNGGDPLAALEDEQALHGFGCGVDLGAVTELGSLRLGLSVRDFLGTRFSYRRSTVSQVLGSLGSTFRLPTGTAVEEDYVIPMTVGLGAAWHPDLGAAKAVIDPVFHADLQGITPGHGGESSLRTLLHAGVEIGLFSCLAVRAGLNQGHLTVGGGLKLLFLELDWALYTREMGRNAGDRPGPGLAVEGAIRF